MKFFLLFLLFATQQSFAEDIEVTCNAGDNHCVDRSNWPIRRARGFGLFFAKATGNSLDEIRNKGEETLYQNYPERRRDGELTVRCGASNGRPYVLDQTCERTRSGKTSCWVVCNHYPSSGGGRDRRSDQICAVNFQFCR